MAETLTVSVVLVALDADTAPGLAALSVLAHRVDVTSRAGGEGSMHASTAALSSAPDCGTNPATAVKGEGYTLRVRFGALVIIWHNHRHIN